MRLLSSRSALNPHRSHPALPLALRLAGGLLVCLLLLPAKSFAEGEPKTLPDESVNAPANGSAKPSFVPSFFDTRHLPDKPPGPAARTVRFLTEEDNPPFHFALADGTLIGFDIDLARALCEELQWTCTIQARHFDMLEPALRAGEGDVLIAALRVDRAAKPGLAFSAPYYTTPARFAAKRGSTLDAVPEGFKGKTIGVEQATAHEAYLKTFFPDAIPKPFPSLAEAQEALRKGELDAVFGDGIQLALWLNGTDAQNCCAFRGGPYTESAYFGEGIGMALREEDRDLKRLIDYGLARVTQRGLYAEYYLKYFPLGFY